MDVRLELDDMQSHLLREISTAASNQDFSRVAELSTWAKECEQLGKEFASFCRRVKATKEAIGIPFTVSTALHKPLRIQRTDALMSTDAQTGKQVRNEWIARLEERGIYLRGSRRQYRTMGGRSVAVAFANERQPDKWFLGMPDEGTDIAVLLCRAATGDLYDIVLPVWKAQAAWGSLSRANGDLKINVRRRQGTFVLLIPRGSTLEITRYLGDYSPLR